MQHIEFNVDVNGDGDGDKSRLIQWMILINVLRDIHQRNNETGQRTDLDGCDISFCLWLCLCVFLFLILFLILFLFLFLFVGASLRDVDFAFWLESNWLWGGLAVGMPAGIGDT